MALELLLRLLHILPAILLAGGIFFMWGALMPALGTVGEESRATLMSAVRGRWSKVVMVCTVLLLVTGIWNAVRNIVAYEFDGFPGRYYHHFVAVKLLLALAIFFLTALIGGRSSLAEKVRQKLPLWMAVNTALLLALILVASTMKVSHRELKPDYETAWGASEFDRRCSFVRGGRQGVLFAVNRDYLEAATKPNGDLRSSRCGSVERPATAAFCDGLLAWEGQSCPSPVRI